jgi:hypothetical protein
MASDRYHSFALRRGAIGRDSTKSQAENYRPGVPRRGGQTPRNAWLTLHAKASLILDKAHDVLDALTGVQVAEHERPLPPHTPGVTLHDLK